MYLGKNIKVVSIVEYKDNSLIFVKNNIVGKNNIGIFNEEWYPELENISKEEIKSQINKLKINKFYLLSDNSYNLKLVPYFIYTKKRLLKKLEDTNLELDFVKTKKRNER